MMAHSKYCKVVVFATEKEIDALDNILSLPALLAMVRKVELVNASTNTFSYLIEVDKKMFHILLDEKMKGHLQEVKLV